MNNYVEYSTSKAVYHTDKIRALQQNKMIAPTHLQIDPEAFCNDSCEFCAYRKPDGYNNTMLKLLNLKEDEKHGGFKPLGMINESSSMPLEMADKIPAMMKDAGVPAIEITGGGEPTLWRGFDRLLDNLIDAKREIGLVTNGSTLPDKRITRLARNCMWIRFSMDSSNPETHKLIHRTSNEDFYRRVENIKKIIQRKNKELIVGISFIVTPNNIHDVEKSAYFYKSIGANHLRVSFMYDKQGTAGLTENQIHTLTATLDGLQPKLNTTDFRLIYEKGRIDTYSRPNDDFDKCYMQNFVWAVGADCLVYPCCIMKYHPEFALGDLRITTIKDMVYDMNVKAKMQNLDVTKCFPCWLRSRNKAMAPAIEEPMHKNFI